MIEGHCLGGACGHIKAYETHIKGESILKDRWADMPYVCWGEH